MKDKIEKISEKIDKIEDELKPLKHRFFKTQGVLAFLIAMFFRKAVYNERRCKKARYVPEAFWPAHHHFKCK